MLSAASSSLCLSLVSYSSHLLHTSNQTQMHRNRSVHTRQVVQVWGWEHQGYLADGGHHGSLRRRNQRVTRGGQPPDYAVESIGSVRLTTRDMFFLVYMRIYIDWLGKFAPEPSGDNVMIFSMCTSLISNYSPDVQIERPSLDQNSFLLRSAQERHSVPPKLPELQELPTWRTQLTKLWYRASSRRRV
jgi:hypothetical protein